MLTETKNMNEKISQKRMIPNQSFYKLQLRSLMIYKGATTTDRNSLKKCKMHACSNIRRP